MKIAIVLLSLMIAACSPDSPKLQARPDLTVEKVVKENDYLVQDPKVDILFVIDNSGSMDTHQKNLASNIGRFTSVFFKKSNIDFHIGVVSTDMGNSGIVSNCCGRLFGNPIYVDRRTPSPEMELSKRILMGINGSGTERLFDPVIAALTPPMITGYNSGFLRSGAHLAVIFITDAEDQSDSSPSTFYDFLLKLKGKREKFLAYASVIPTGYEDPLCQRDETDKTPQKIEQFLSMTMNSGKNLFNLCTPDFGDKLGKVAEDLAREVSNTIYLNRAPVMETLRVFYGTQEILSDPVYGWSFDAELNAIHLGDKIQLDPNQIDGTKIRVDFEAASYLED